jgi:GT2 family glycosyltransferase
MAETAAAAPLCASNVLSPIDVVVVNYRTPEALRRCLQSIPAAHHTRTWVVDNASGDESCYVVQREFPGVHLIASEENIFFAGGVAAGMAYCDAPYVLVLNADVEVSADALAVLGEELDAHPECGLVGPRVDGHDGQLQPSCFPEPSPRDYLISEIGLVRIARRFRLGRGGRLSLRLWDHAQEREVPWVLGCAFAVRRGAFDEVGGFDSRFPMYFEEVDLCARLRSGGWTVRFTPRTAVRHEGGASTRQQQREMSRRMYRSMATYYRVHAPGALIRLRVAVVAALVGLAAKSLPRCAFADGRRGLGRQLHGYLVIAADAVRGWEAP